MQSASRNQALSCSAASRWAAGACVLRLGVFVATVCVLFFALLLRLVQADGREAMWAAGARAMQYPGASHEAVRRLQLNGVGISFRTQTVDAALADVLAYYEGLCDTDIATQSVRNESTGYVACLDMGRAPQNLGALVQRFIGFSETGDLREVGALRYVFARRVEGSAENETFLFTMWADSTIDIDRMLPHQNADAAGQDLVGVPRPLGSQRILSAREAQRPSGVFVYRVLAKSAGEIESFYRRELTKAGWKIIEKNPSESIQIDGTYMLSAEKDGRLVTVLSRSGTSSQTVLTILGSERS